MLGHSLGVVALCALAADAILLPPGVAPANNDLSVKVFDPKSQIIVLPCSECAFPVKHGKVEESAAEGDDLFWIQGGANSVVLDFTISEDGRSLQLGKETIYPMNIAGNGIAGMAKSIYVNQVPSSISDAELQSGEAGTPLQITASGMTVTSEQSASPNGDGIVTLKWQTMALEHQFVSLDTVEVPLLRTSDGELLILGLTNAPNPEKEFWGLPFPQPPAPGTEMDEHTPFPAPAEFGTHKECNMLPASLCKFKDMLESKLDKIRHGHGKGKVGGCHGRKGDKPSGHMKPHPDFEGEEAGSKQHHGHPHHMRLHGQYHEHGQFGHHFLHAFVKGLIAVLIPIMAGVAVGLSVSLLGLLVGRLIGFLWLKFARGGRRPYTHVPQQEVVMEEGEDKNLVAEMEAPPVYEEAPAYEAVEIERK